MDHRSGIADHDRDRRPLGLRFSRQRQGDGADDRKGEDRQRSGLHGVIAIPTYIDRVKAGHIVPGAKWTIVQESPTTTVIDGHWGFGFHVNAKAMALTIDKAKNANEAACTVFR